MIDSVPTQSSNNLVTSGGVFEAIQDVDNAVDELVTTTSTINQNLNDLIKYSEIYTAQITSDMWVENADGYYVRPQSFPHPSSLNIKRVLNIELIDWTGKGIFIFYGIQGGMGFISDTKNITRVQYRIIYI